MSASCIRSIATGATSRFDLWASFINQMKLASVVEIGVKRGEFAEQILKRCPSVERYYMIDPWRHLEQWGKPGNVSDEEHEAYYREAMARTQFAASRRIVLRAPTAEAVARLPYRMLLSLAYIDGDHTLRGITIDLIALWTKVGYIGGDDFLADQWHHGSGYEPTMVFPFAVHFAETMGATIYGLPFNQFLIAEVDRFRFHDLTGKYGEAKVRCFT